jgi:xylulokinase
MDSKVRAAFFGMSLNHSQAHLVRAVMEGVVFALRQGLDLMQALGVPLERLVASGGATRHPLWLQLQADIFGQPIYVSQQQEATGRGAALLAGIGCGIYRDALHAINRTVELSGQAVIQPQLEHVARYAKAYRQYCQFYPVLKAAGVADR